MIQMRERETELPIATYANDDFTKAAYVWVKNGKYSVTMQNPLSGEPLSGSVKVFRDFDDAVRYAQKMAVGFFGRFRPSSDRNHPAYEGTMRERYFTSVKDGFGDYVEIFINPSMTELHKLYAEHGDPSASEKTLRFIADDDKRSVYVFPEDFLHEDAFDALNLPDRKSGRYIRGIALKHGARWVAYVFSGVVAKQAVRSVRTRDWSWAEKYIPGLVDMVKVGRFDESVKLNENDPVVTKRLTPEQARELLTWHGGWNTEEDYPSNGRAVCRICGHKIAKGEECIKTYTDFSGNSEWDRPAGYAVTTIFMHRGCVRN